MDNKNKVVIVVLIVLAVLFFTGVAGNLVPKQREDTDRDEYSKQQQQGEGGWETTLGKWMAPFAPSLDVKKLLSDNSDKCKSETYDYTDKAITLTKTHDTCEIVIAEFTDEKYKKGTLRLLKEGPEIPDVKLQYLPDGKNKEDEDYQPVSFKDYPDKLENSFVVLKEGGSLTVTCIGCFENQDRTIRIIFK